MKFLANENLPVQSLRILRQKGFEIVSVAEVSAGLRDEEVLKLAKTESRIAPRSPEYIANKIESLLKAKEVTFEGKFVVVTESRIRVTSLMKKK